MTDEVAELDLSPIDLSHVDRIVEEIGGDPRAVIPILQAIQEQYRYLPEEALRRACEITEITPARIAGVSTFYSEFRHRPMGEHLIHVCHGTACHVKGAPVISEAYHRHLHIPEGDDTDPERLFTVQKVGCLGCCSLAVVVRIGDTIYGHVTAENVPATIQDVFEREKERKGRARRRPGEGGVEAGAAGEIRICLDSCCVARGCGRVHEALERALASLFGETGAGPVLKRTSCVVVCNETPLLEIAAPGEPVVRYAQVLPEDARAIIMRHFRPRGIVRKVRVAVSTALETILTDEAWEPVTRYSINMREPRITAFVGRQKHIAMEHYGVMDPTDLDAYIEHDGFKALERCLRELTPERVIEEITKSGLRGRGGAGFPTGTKWSRVRRAEGPQKYIVANGDEGDPGAFMDRMLLESFPYRVIEGMLIAAYAVGANEGRLYIRSEYPFAVARMKEALARCRERGVIGDDVLGMSNDNGFSCRPYVSQGGSAAPAPPPQHDRQDMLASGHDIAKPPHCQAAVSSRFLLQIMRGAGAFVCGEETALLASIEGRRGTPRLRPPYPSDRGLWGKPTLVNNVETYALVPWIVREGAQGFASLGTEKSKGTKVFALAGKTVRGGLIEVPMGVTIREIVEEIGGGIAGGRRFKAALVGGPSGGCVPARLADTPVDYEALNRVGAMMGSGGLVVLDESDCMVDIARYFLEFTQDQSCGKCTFCRIGTRRMLDVLTRLCSGEGKKADIGELERLSRFVKEGSLCGLGKTAPNPVLTTLRYFRDEYEAHVEGRCPAGKCKALIRYYVTDDCIGCTKCAQNCPSEAIAMTPYQKHEIDPEKCTRCGTCELICPAEAIRVE